MKEMLKDMWNGIKSRPFAIIVTAITCVILFTVGLNRLLHLMLGADSMAADVVPGLLLIPIGIIIIVKVTKYLNK
jgi:hypothetical protein